MPNTAVKVVPVATGILRRSDGRLLLSLRPEGKPWPGLWEFPGGKIEVNESPETALGRELWEEIGIRVRQARLLRQVDHAYPERVVGLHFFLVEDWEGKPWGREGQELRWCQPWEIPSLRCLEPNLPLVALLQRENLPSPPLWLIADLGRVSPDRFLPILDQVIAAGLRALVLRSKTPLLPVLREALPAWLAKAQEQGVAVFWNGLEDAPHSWPLAGLHLPEGSLVAGKIPAGPFGVSCHSSDCLRRAAQQQARYAFLSPVFPTSTHPGASTLGLGGLTQAIANAALPVIALGGIGPQHLVELQTAGAAGVAVLSGILEAPDPASAFSEYLHAWSSSCPNSP